MNQLVIIFRAVQLTQGEGPYPERVMKSNEEPYTSLVKLNLEGWIELSNIERKK